MKRVYAMPIACRTPSTAMIRERKRASAGRQYSGVCLQATPLTDACLTASMLYLCCRRPGAAAAEPQLQPQAQAVARAALPFAERELAFPSFDLASQVSSKLR